MRGSHSMVLGLIVPLWACGTVPPTPTSHSSLLLEANPSIFVIAAKQKSASVASLREAGLVVVDDLAESSHQLRVTMGVDKSSRPCGTLNNVKYALRSQGNTILELRGRGWSGDCQPSVFDVMGKEMARRIRAGMASTRSD